uniref:Layilin a n=1 Tax=Cyprinodon variegatus TaxID=28743 RepID=A0A3Q2CXQ4_CYPVA
RRRLHALNAHLLLIMLLENDIIWINIAILCQRVCKAGNGKPCYKLAYFSELRWKLNFQEAESACKRDGGQLLSIESASEQKVIEQLISDLRPMDGDFWIGLRRGQGHQDSSSECSSQYYWLDGSKSTFSSSLSITN